MLANISNNYIKKMNSNEEAILKNVLFDLDDMFDTYKKFYGIFESAKNIEAGDKISIQENKLVLFKSGSLQFVQRWWSNENRTKSTDNLETCLSDYFKFLDMCALCVKNNKKETRCFSKTYNKSLLDLVVHVTEMNKFLIKGLKNLETTYSDTLIIKTRYSNFVKIIKGFNKDINKHFFMKFQ